MATKARRSTTTTTPSAILNAGANTKTKSTTSTASKNINPVAVVSRPTKPAVQVQTPTANYSNSYAATTANSSQPVKTVNNTQRAVSKAVSTPVSTPVSNTVAGNRGTTTAPVVGTSINAGNLLQTSIDRQLADQAQQGVLEPSVVNRMEEAQQAQAAINRNKANENPSERTDRYLGVLNSITGARGTSSRPYSNPNFAYDQSRGNNGVSLDIDNDSINNLVSNYIRNQLVGEVGDNKPFAEVPTQSAYEAVINPTTVVRNQQSTPTLSDLINAQFERDYGVGTNNPITAAVTGQTLNPYATQAIANAAADFADRAKGGDTNNTNNYGYRAGGSGRTGGVGGTGAYDSAYDLDALYDLLNRQLAEYNNQYDSLMANLLSAYDMNNASLDDYYNQILAVLGNNYADTEGLLRGELGNSQQALEDDRRRALQEAYIARMMQEKQLADQLDAYGLSGGASESVMANLRNNYLNNRANVEEKVQTSLKDLLQNYLSNLSNARQNYNQSLMNAEQNRLSARQGYANNLAEAQANAANYLANARSGAYENLFNALAKQYLG